MKWVHKTVQKMITGQAERVGLVQTGEEKGPRRLFCHSSTYRVLLRKTKIDFLVEPAVIGQG